MVEDIRNTLSRAWPGFCERVLKDLHHLGIAVVPAVCERLLAVAVLVVAVFLALAALEALVEGNNV